MAPGRTTLPAPVLDALDALAKAAEKYGRSSAVGSPMADSKQKELVQTRERAVRAIEEHATAMYDGGIEIGLAQAEASAR